MIVAGIVTVTELTSTAAGLNVAVACPCALPALAVAVTDSATVSVTLSVAMPEASVVAFSVVVALAVLLLKLRATLAFATGWPLGLVTVARNVFADVPSASALFAVTATKTEDIVGTNVTVACPARHWLKH